MIFIPFTNFSVNVSAKNSQLDELKNYGYVSVSEAINRYENYTNLKVNLPSKIPPVPFTHIYGRFDNKKDDYLEIRFLNRKSPSFHYMIHIMPKTAIDDFGIEKSYILDDGTKARYITKRIKGFNLLIFNKDNLKIILSVDKRISKIVTLEKLVEIANSVEEKTEKKGFKL